MWGSDFFREFSKETVRRFLVQRQSFLRYTGKNGTLKAVKKLECIQRDPISVVHRNHHLVLHNRVLDYKPSYLDDLLYNDRLLFEYWCNAKSIVPMDDFHYFRHRMRNPSQFHSPFFERIKRRREELKDCALLVLTEIRKHGPLSSKELETNGKLKRRNATRVLNLLWDSGDLMIHHMEGNRRYYGLTELLLPANVDSRTMNREEYAQFMVEKYMRAHGLVDTRDWRFGWLSLNASQRKTTVKEMMKEQKLIQIKVKGLNQVYYVLKEYIELLESSDEQVRESVFFVAPLDNLLWNRRLIAEVFNFDYAWEVYKTPEKRMYGYYVMPILFGSRFVGRLDPKLDRRNQKMIINSVHLEEKNIERDIFTSEFAKAFQRFLEFHDVSKFNIQKTEPKRLRDLLMNESGSLTRR